MPTPTIGPSLDEQDHGSELSNHSATSRKRKRKRDEFPSEEMSPGEEASASPPAAVIAGREEDERRMSSPPSGSKFLHDDVHMTRISDVADANVAKMRPDVESEGSEDDEYTTTTTANKLGKCKTKDSTTRGFAPENDDSCGTSDVEKFAGKIVYNPDGSAYIIEDSELSEEDTSLADLPMIGGDGCIVDGRGVSLSQYQVFPQIANAFYVSRNPSLYNALYGSTAAYASTILQDKKIVPEVPIMHSYRVYTVRDNKAGDSDDKLEEEVDTAEEKKKKNDKFGKDCSSVPVKPILMCFICKLSFGYAKSFVAHAMGDHNVSLLEDEKDILGHKNASAIIQCVGKDKEPLVSFLEPLASNERDVARPATLPPASAYSAQMMAAAAAAVTLANTSLSSVGVNSTAQLVPSEKLLRETSSSSGGCAAAAVDDAVDPLHRVSPSSDGKTDCKLASADCAESLVMHHRRGGQESASPLSRSNVQIHHVPETSVSLPQNGSNSSNNINVHNNRMMTPGGGMNSVMDLTRKSPVSSGNNERGSVSPRASPSPLSPLMAGGNMSISAYPQAPPNFLTGTTIGVCPDHMGGRPSGVECAKCELILSSSRLGGVGGPLAGMHSRNSCKTLKCPKCNWHYKYQETLEIHMKEKHPETETSCIYCIAGQPHPRLARGETYTCGYKPYRCEVCNYSTTTKGNLSIHMQSDKHLNNMQELQNGGVPNTENNPHQTHSTPPSSQHKSGLVSPSSAPPQSPHMHHQHHHTPLSSGGQSQKPKPTFRCDVCNYETNVARNLRIHMTSEKHTHNMMVLQQNVKHMQTLSALQHHQQQQQQQQSQHHAAALSFESLLHFHPGLTLPGEKPPPHTEAALADMAYNQALLIQMMTGGQLPPHIPPELAPHMDMGLNPETMEPPPEPADANPSQMFHCCVCNVFSTDSLEALSHHLSADRTKIREQEILAVVAGHYVCKLCTYKTNLKANFQLHCKTDKHLQRLQHVNHVKEGGPRNEWKLKYVSSPGGIQVRCHACDYYTNSAHKLQLHAAGQRHEASCLLFVHIREAEATVSPDARVYHCALCGFSSRAKLPLLQHVRAMKHLQMEQLHQLQRRGEGKDVHTDIGEVFQVHSQLDHSFTENDSDRKESQRSRDNSRERSESVKSESKESILQRFVMSNDDGDDANTAEHTHMCPYCNYTSSSEMRIQAHVLAQHSQSEPSPQELTSPSRDFLCPLCQDGFRDRSALERHVMQIHSVNSEGLQRLLLLVDQSHWLNQVNRSTPTTPQNNHNQQTPPLSNSHNQMISPSSASSGGSSIGGKDLDSSGKQNNSDANSLEDRDDVRPDLLSPSPDDMIEDEFRCQTCFKSFRNIDELCGHQNDTGHFEMKQTPTGTGYLCWKKGCNQYFTSAHSLQMHFREIHVRGGGGGGGGGGPNQGISVSEKHVYKYRCNQCSLAFKTVEKLQLHSQYHMIRDATKCVLCGRSFRSVLALHKHVETSHSELSEDELNAYKHSLMSNPLLLAGLSGQVLDASTNEMLKKESLKMEADDMDMDDSHCKENQDEGMGNNQSGDGENSDDSVVYKEQQFLEDYLNSQAIAEDSYNDPNRKYKCHRCKVAFTRQSYLTSHNKTLLHRKGEKLSYPMEKYLDPNRPYKCDVCKESFTQKNILLVHYNSVSHLHKLKRAMQEQQQQHNNNNNNNGMTVVSPHAAAAALVASLGVTPPPTPKSMASEDDDKKPYKCNICKVAYSQGSTLDIHMRSVLHQTRASKLQDLAISGQIDLSKPLIEQPEPQKAQEQHKKMLQDILGTSPKQQLTSPASSSSGGGGSVSSQAASLGLGSSPTMCSNIVPNNTSASGGCSTPTTSVASSTVPTSCSSTTSSIHQVQAATSHGMLACPRCSALFVSQEQLSTHQQLYCLFGSPMSMFPPMQTAANALNSPQPNKTPPPLTVQDESYSRLSISNKKHSQVYKHLLESFGFDLVMQFNENHQKRQKKDRETDEIVLAEPPSGGVDAAEESGPVAVKIEEEGLLEDLPELSKSSCQHCRKDFSSVWVLKAHCEEVHRDLVPFEFLEKYAQQFKSEYEKKAASNPLGADDAEDNKEALQAKIAAHRGTPPDMNTAPSTPTASSTPASSTDSIPVTMSSSMAAAVAAGMMQGGNSQMSMSLAQQMNEMQAALNVMAASQLQQQLQQFNPMMMSMMGLPMGLNMNALAAMNLQPPLVPMMMPPPSYEQMSQMSQAQFSPQGGGGMDHGAMMAKQQHHLLQQQQQAVSAAQQKRARTRITDDQLKILRAHFDINNSPSEEQIHEMASQSGLPPKVIKHWFRNTLFKERQRNKDSPYNFNNPPSTTLNLEEYEKTGETKTVPLNSSGSSDEPPPPPVKEFTPKLPPSTNKRKQSTPQPFPQPQPFPETPKMIKVEPRDPNVSQDDNQDLKFNNLFMNEHRKEAERIIRDLPDEKMQNLHQPPQSPVSTVSGSFNEQVSPRMSSPDRLTLTSIIASQLGTDAMTMANANMSNMTVTSTMLPPKMTPTNYCPSGQVPTSPGLPMSSGRSLSPGRSYNNNSSDGFSHASLTGGCGGGNSNGSNSSGGSSGKRANRTRFTDYQIKVLQEFFENNAYPKDDDLEYLSKLLGLSPRVIVVWFQNARQKARKVYENQPPVETPPGVGETEANRFQRTPGLNYQCKKCLLVFQRYYELIRHQKTHCFKEEDAKRSAQAQAAAAQIAAVLSSEDSNSSISEQCQQQLQQPLSTSNPTTPAPAVTPTPSVTPYPPSPVPSNASNSAVEAKEGTFQCDKCNLVFPRFDLWREHQLVHIMNPNLFPSYPPDSPFGILQQHAQLQQQQQQQQMAGMGVADLSMGSSAGSPHPLASMLSANKRKFDEYDDAMDRDCDQPKDKRLRTTILPEQLDYLYQKYQLESNPSRKMLENIAREVGLKKRVVQVWFQNTRARERKGQFRAHAQVINKRCPFCPALFKVKSALESHLVTKHADQCTRGEINIDALPDEELSMESTSYTSSHMGDGAKTPNNFGGSTTPTPNMMPPLFPPFHQDMENSLKKYYEESMKRYITELQAHHAAQNGVKEGADLSMKIKQEPSGEGGERVGGDAPLDLSKPVDLSRPMKHEVGMEHGMMTEQGPFTDLSERSIFYDDDSMEMTMDMNMDMMDGDESNPASPASSTQSGHQRNLSSGGGGGGNKRYRTQMSSIQVKAMKSLFGDYKTPTMAECEMLGREIGLQKRVVQVWFQNARAKEKKYKLALQKALGGPESAIDAARQPEECKLCQFKYSHKYSIQDHIFTKKHIDNVKLHLENGKNASADASGNNSDGEFIAPPPVPGSSINADSTTAATPPQQFNNVGGNAQQQQQQQQQQLAQLQMLQMAAASGMTLPNSLTMAMAAAAKDQQHGGSKSPAPGPEDMALLQQLYGMGIPGFPQGNLFLHPAMFGANGGGGLFDPPNSLPGTSGTPLSMLQLPQETLQKINEDASASKPGVTTLRVATLEEPVGAPLPAFARETLVEVGFVCKKCRLAYPSETGLLGHQRTACFPGKHADNRGAIRLTQTVYECKICPGAKKAKTILEFRQHCDTEVHGKKRNAYLLHPPPPPPPLAIRGRHLSAATPPTSVSPSSGLTHEMEDVVNQITLLAARAAEESAPGVTDSNANIAGEPKRVKMFLHPSEAVGPMAVSTGQ